MDMRRRRMVVFLVAFFCIYAASNSEGNWKSAYNFVGKKFSWDVQDIDEDTAEELWIRCWSQLNERIETVEGLEFYSYESSSSSGNRKIDKHLLARRIIQKVISDLPSPGRHFIFECLKEKISHNELGTASSYRTVFNTLQELYSNWFTFPRRFLRHRKNHHRMISPSPAPGPLASSPNSAPTPSYQVPASSPSPVLLPPPPVLQPPSSASEPFAPDPNSFISSSPSPRIQPPPKNLYPPIRPPISSGNEHKEQKYIIAAISVGVMAGLAILALFLFFFVKGRKNKVGPRENQRNGIRDKRPLLNICSSEVSAVSSQNFQSIGGLNSKLQETSSAVGNIPMFPNALQSGSQPSEGTAVAPGNYQAPLPLPPGKSAPSPPRPPPKPPAPSPPPPPKMVRPPNPPKRGNKLKPSPLGPHHQSKDEGTDVSGDSDAPKAKLKPFFWEKVLANPDHSMVWHDIKAGSFQFNEEMMESLFGYSTTEKSNNPNRKESSSSQSFIQIIDAKKAQNLAILLKALNVTTEEVCDAIKEGNELPIELIQTLLKMAPTTEEELKLRLFEGDASQLGPAEQFLKVMVDIPYAFKRLEALAFMGFFHEEASSVAESFTTLEVACNELKNSRLIPKLLEAVLKTGNRMNDGTYRGGAQAFKLDTLLKLSDVKGTDGKTTLLHFVVREIIRSEGVRAARGLRESPSVSSFKTEDLNDDSSQETLEYHRSLGLQVVSGLSIELENVRKAAIIDGANLAATVSKLERLLKKSKEFLENEMSNVQEESEFSSALANFLKQAETEITKLTEEETRTRALVKSTGDYFHGKAGKDDGLPLFVIIRDFLIMVDKECKEVKNSTNLPVKSRRKETLSTSSSHESRQDSFPELHQRLFPAIKQQQIEDSSSDDESYSP